MGLVLEFSLPLLMWLCVLFLSGLVYRETAATFFSEHLRHWIPYAIASVLLIGVLLYCFVSSPKEHEQLLRDQGNEAFKGLPSDVQRRLRRLREILVKSGKLEEEVGKLSHPVPLVLFVFMERIPAPSALPLDHGSGLCW